MKRQICFYIESRYRKDTGRRAVLLFPVWSLSPYVGGLAPLFRRSVSNKPDYCITSGGGQG